MAALLYRALSPSGRRLPAALISFVLAAGIGVINEIWQGFVPNRTPEAADSLANSAGALAGILVFLAFSRRKPKGGARTGLPDDHSGGDADGAAGGS